MRSTPFLYFRRNTIFCGSRKQISLYLVSKNKKMFANMCEFYEVPMFIYGTKDELGHAMGKEMRASLAITDPGFAKSLMRLLEK